MKSHWLVSLGGLCLLACPAWADPPRGLLRGHGKGTPGPYTPGPCLPTPAPSTPTPPSTAPPRPVIPPGTPDGTTPPGERPTDPAPTTPDQPGEAPAGGAESYASWSPSMFGDAFGGVTQQLTARLPMRVPIPKTFVDATGAPLVFPSVTQNGTTVFLTPPLGLTRVFGIPITENFVASGGLQPTGRGPVFPLRENSQDAAATLARGPLVFVRPTPTPAELATGFVRYNANPNESFAQPVAGGANITTTYDYIFLRETPTTIALPSPTYGGVVGRTKIAEYNSPLPRDRIIFNYDYFADVPLNARGVGVHKFSPGIEKTFFDRQASIEIRVPFSSTLTTNLISDGSTTGTAAEFGNMTITLKALLYGDETWNVSAGLGVALPTADDIRIFDQFSGVEVFRIKNDTIVLTPYIAYLYTPNESFFFQNWVALGFNTVGNPVLANQDLGGLRQAGRLFDQHLLQVDAQMGYWLIHPRESTGYLRGLAPFVELHWNINVGNADVVRGNQFAFGPANGNFNELNLAIGAVVQLGDRSNLTIGAAVPLLNDNNRTFDYQIGIRANVFFGPTLRANDPATQISAF